MKTSHFLAAFLLSMFLTSHFSFAQNEIEKYELPKLIEGSNLYVSNFTSFYSSNTNDSIKWNNMNVDLNSLYRKWRFTRRLNYSANLSAGFNYTRNGVKNSIQDTVFKYIYGGLNFEGGLSYYLLKDLLYAGTHLRSNERFSSRSKPFFSNSGYVYLGIGRLVNAGQVMYTKNFENILLDEKITSKKLPYNVFNKLTVLLDKRREDEFISKYKDDADIEFFSQVEKLLLDEGIISSPLGSRSTLKLFQSLTNFSFVYFPRYKGYSVQLELNYNNLKNEFEKEHNSQFLNLSIVYGLPIGSKTALAFSCFAGYPIRNDSVYYYDYSFYNSPITIIEFYVPYYPETYYLETKKYDYLLGAKAIAYYNISAVAGIMGYINADFGKTSYSKNDYSITSVIDFRYNILSRLTADLHFQFIKEEQPRTVFSGGLSLDYTIF